MWIPKTASGELDIFPHGEVKGRFSLCGGEIFSSIGKWFLVVFDSKPNMETGIIDSFKNNFITGHSAPYVPYIPQMLILRKCKYCWIPQILSSNPKNFGVRLEGKGNGWRVCWCPELCKLAQKERQLTHSSRRVWCWGSYVWNILDITLQIFVEWDDDCTWLDSGSGSTNQELASES